VYAEEFEVIDGGVSSLVPPEVHNELICFANVEGEVIYLAPRRQSASQPPCRLSGLCWLLMSCHQ
jgi:hypothetical protein